MAEIEETEDLRGARVDVSAFVCAVHFPVELIQKLITPPTEG